MHILCACTYKIAHKYYVWMQNLLSILTLWSSSYCHLYVIIDISVVCRSLKCICYWRTLLYAVKMYSSHWLLKKLLRPVVSQNKVRQERHTENTERRVESSREIQPATQEERYQQTSNATATWQCTDE